MTGPVVLVTGDVGAARSWQLRQIPSLTAAGYSVVTMCHAGTPAEFIERVTAEYPERSMFIGYSRGAFLVQELMLAAPRLVDRAVLVAARGREDALSSALAEAEHVGQPLPDAYGRYLRVVLNFAPATLADGPLVEDLLDLYDMNPDRERSPWPGPSPDRLAAYRDIRVPMLAIAFEQDLLVNPARVVELAEAVPGARLLRIPEAGHAGHVEKWSEVSSAILRFFEEAVDEF